MSSAAQAVAQSDIGGEATASDVSAISVSPKPSGIDDAAAKSVRPKTVRGNVPRTKASLFDAFDGHILSALKERDHSARLAGGLLFEWSEPELDAEGKPTGWYTARVRLSNLALGASISRKTLGRCLTKLEALEELKLSRHDDNRSEAFSDENRSEVLGDANASRRGERRIDGGRRQKGTFIAGNAARRGHRNDPVVLFRFFLGEALPEIDRRRAAGELVVRGGLKPMDGVLLSPAFDGYSRSAKTVYAIRFAHSDKDGISRVAKDRGRCTACGKHCPCLVKCPCGQGEGRSIKGEGSLPLRSHLSRATVVRAERDLMTARCSAKEAKRRRELGALELAGDGAGVLERRIVEVIEGGKEATQKRTKRARFRNLVLPQGGPHGQWVRVGLPPGVLELPARVLRATGQNEIGLGSIRDPRWDKMSPEAVGEAGLEETASPSIESASPIAPASQAIGVRPASPPAGHKSASPTGLETSSRCVKVAIPQRERPVLEAWFRTRSKAPFDSIDFARFATDRATRATVRRWLEYKVVTFEGGIEEEVSPDQLARAIGRWPLDAHWRSHEFLFVMASPRRVEELLNERRWKRTGPKDQRLDATAKAEIKAAAKPSLPPAERIAPPAGKPSPAAAERIRERASDRDAFDASGFSLTNASPAAVARSLPLPTCGAPGVIVRPANTTSPPSSSSSTPAPISIDGLFFDEDGRRKPRDEIKRQLDAVLRKQLSPKPDFDSTKRSR